MSRNHVRDGTAAFLRKMRPSVAATLPAPCVNLCQMGGTVRPEQAWDVGHIVSKEAGGRDERSNVGPAHRRCNRSDGGKVGAAMTNNRRRHARRQRTW